MTSFNTVFYNRPKSIFPTMSALAQKHDAINLGQGFPDEDGPQEMLRHAAEAMLEGPNQYVPVEGVPALRAAVARDNKRFYGLEIDPLTETLVVSGATEGLAACFLGLLNPGDEVIIFAPFYECYAPQIEATGARAVSISLKPPDWRIDPVALKEKISSRTKLIVINTPHNPLGKVMSDAELQDIADCALANDLVVVCDEVYEHLIFEPHIHRPLMTFPGMRERCIRVGSAGKTFSVTGWRIGYLTGTSALIEAVAKAHQHLAYTSPGHLQHAVAHALEFGDDYYTAFKEGMMSKRDFLSRELEKAGFSVGDCAGTYFLTVDIAPFGFDDDMAFCRDVTEHAKVAAVPISSFYLPDESEKPRNFVRFCFCKRETVLSEAAERLNRYLNNR